MVKMNNNKKLLLFFSLWTVSFAKAGLTNDLFLQNNDALSLQKKDTKLSNSEINKALPFSKTSREQKVLLFSADIPSDEPERKGELMFVTIFPCHQNEDSSIIVGQHSTRKIRASVEGEPRNSVKLKIPRYFMSLENKKKYYETNVFEIHVEMPYYGTEKVDHPSIVKYEIGLDWSNEEEEEETVRLTVDNDLLFRAPFDAFIITPYEAEGLEENEEDYESPTASSSAE